MQQRRKIPLIFLLVVLTLAAGVYGLSYVYTPKPSQQTVTVKVTPDVMRKPVDNTNQPIEYP